MGLSGLRVPLARLRSGLDRPLARRYLLLGMVVATGVWVLVVVVAGGIASGDAPQTLLPTMALAHGQLACSYPPTPGNAPTFTTPLLPMLAAPFIAFFHAGATAFPQGSSLGAGCTSANTAISTWLSQPGGMGTLIWTVAVGWLVLLAGVVAIMRTSRRGRTWWEPITLIVVAICPPVIESVTHLFHPEGYLSLGVVLLALAAFRRGMWTLAGVGFAAAVLAHQFALLLVVPLFVLMTREQIRRVAVGGLLGIAAFLGPIVAITHFRVIYSLTGAGDTSSPGGVWLASLFHHLGASELLTLSRGTPIFLTAMCALYIRLRHRGAPITSDLALALGAVGFLLRLIFEVYMFDYYFLAAAVALVLAEVTFGRVRWTLFAWMTALFVVYDPFAWIPHAPLGAVPSWVIQLSLSVSGLALALSQLSASAHRAAAPMPVTFPVSLIPDLQAAPAG